MDKWTKDWPEYGGQYYFYGWRFRDRDQPAELHMVDVWEVVNGTLYSTRGGFIHKAEGAEGYWKPVDVIIPTEIDRWANNLLVKGNPSDLGESHE